MLRIETVVEGNEPNRVANHGPSRDVLAFDNVQDRSGDVYTFASESISRPRDEDFGTTLSRIIEPGSELRPVAYRSRLPVIYVSGNDLQPQLLREGLAVIEHSCLRQVAFANSLGVTYVDRSR